MGGHARDRYTMSMKPLKLFVLPVLWVLGTGCSSVDRFAAVQEAVQGGRVSGLSASSHMDSVVWSFPHTASGPYSKIRSLEATTTNNPTNEQTYVFFVGKSRGTGRWEVFSSMLWKADHWEVVPVALPQTEHR